MKLVATKIAAVVVALALGANAARAHDGFTFGVDRCGFGRAGPFQLGFPRFSFGVVVRAPVHVHRWRIVEERVWVAPLFEVVRAGTTRCGEPVFERVCVRAGYWTTVRERVCDCGLRERW